SDGVYNTTFALVQNQGADSCLGLKAVYKIFANGTWRTVESDFSDNLKSFNATDPRNRCDVMTPDVCWTYLNQFPQYACPSSSTLPQSPVNPPTIATPSTGTLKVSWAPPPKAGICKLVSAPDCATSACPAPNGVQEYCSEGDGFHCRL